MNTTETVTVEARDRGDWLAVGRVSFEGARALLSRASNPARLRIVASDGAVWTWAPGNRFVCELPAAVVRVVGDELRVSTPGGVLVRCGVRP